MNDIIAPPFSVVVQEIDALENTETQHSHLMALMRHRAMLAAAPQPPVVAQPQSVTNCHQSQPKVVPPSSTESAYQRGYLDGMAKGRRDAAMDAEEGQEPVAYYVMNGAALFQLFRSKSQAEALVYDLQKRHDLSGSLAHFHVVPLYTHPQPRQPLTNEQVKAGLIDSIDFADQRERCAFNLGVRFAERAHGIGGEA